MLIGGEEDPITMTHLIGGVGQGADADDIRGVEDREAVFRCEALTAFDFLRNRAKGGIADQCRLEGDRSRHVGGQSVNRRTASVTLCPPKPKLLLSAISMSRRTARLGV